MSLSEEKKFFHSEGWQLFFRTLSRVFLICAIFCIFYGAYLWQNRHFRISHIMHKAIRKVTVIVTQNESDEKVAETLVSKKLIYGKTRFVIRKYFSKYKDKSFISGTYEFTQSQGMDDIMGILCGDHVSEEIIQ